MTYNTKKATSYTGCTFCNISQNLQALTFWEWCSTESLPGRYTLHLPVLFSFPVGWLTILERSPLTQAVHSHIQAPISVNDSLYQEKGLLHIKLYVLHLFTVSYQLYFVVCREWYTPQAGIVFPLHTVIPTGLVSAVLVTSCRRHT